LKPLEFLVQKENGDDRCIDGDQIEEDRDLICRDLFQGAVPELIGQQGREKVITNEEN